MANELAAFGSCRGGESATGARGANAAERCRARQCSVSLALARAASLSAALPLLNAAFILYNIYLPFKHGSMANIILFVEEHDVSFRIRSPRSSFES